MKLGFICYDLDEWHANHYSQRIGEVSDGDIAVAVAYGLTVPQNSRANRLWCKEQGIRCADTLKEVVLDCDGIIVLAPDNCEQHEALCSLLLQSQKPIYMDPAFALGNETAARIFAMAEASGTPCWFGSALRFAREYECLPPADTIASWGPSDFETSGIDQLEPIMMLMQGSPERVMALREAACERLLIAFEGGHIATLAFYPGGSPYQMNVAGDSGNRVLTVESDYFNAFIHRLVRFFRTGETPVSHAETLRIIAVRSAGIHAFCHPGEWIAIGPAGICSL